MAKLRANRFNQMVVLVAVCVGSAMLGFVLGDKKTVTASYPPPLLRQSDEKVIERSESPNEPVALGNIRVKKVKIALNQKFSAKSLTESGGGQEGDWLENLEFSFKNTYDKQITYISFQLQFPETEANGPRMAYNLNMGIRPKASEGEIKRSTPLALNPGDKTIFTLSANELKQVKDFLAFGKSQLSDLDRVAIKVVSVTFSDETRWTLGRFYRPNPNAPGGYEPIDR